LKRICENFYDYLKKNNRKDIMTTEYFGVDGRKFDD